MAKKLHQLIAVEKGLKARAYSVLSDIYKQIQKPALFNGLSRTYSKKDDAGEDFPPENKRVEADAETMLTGITDAISEYWDLTLSKDRANQEARADLIVDGQTLITGAPATYLLFLEKQLGDLKSEIDKMPTLDTSYSWMPDPNSKLFRSEGRVTSKTAKVMRAIVKYDATPEHPAQTEMIGEDRIVGSWTAVAISGAMPEPRKKQLQDRVQKLLRAVKEARQEANEVKVDESQKAAASVLIFLISK